MKLTEINSFWSKQIAIEEPPTFLNLTSFWHRFCFNLLCFCMTNIAQKIKIKTMADVGHHMFTKYVCYTPPLTKTNTRIFPVSIVLMMTRLNVKMLVTTKKILKFDRLCRLSKCWTSNEFSVYIHTRSWSMLCDVRVCYRLMSVNAMQTANMHSILLESLRRVI